MSSIQNALPTPRAATRPPFRPGDGLCSCPSLLTSRLGISFAYYGVILASAELLERDLVCGSRSESEVVVTEGVSEESQSPCHCHMFAPSDYQTMIISTIGEIARKCLCVGWLSVSGWGALQKSDLSYTRLLPGGTEQSPNYTDVSPGWMGVGRRLE